MREKIMELKKIYNRSKISECNHPQKQECDKKIIKAHSIQRNGVLSNIARDGKVLGIEPFNYEFHEIGCAKASVLRCFCGKHDKIFSPIEDKKYESKNEQNFLLLYRGLVHSYHVRRELINFFEEYKVDESIIEAKKIGLEDMRAEKEILDEKLLSGNFEGVNAFYIELEGNFPLVCSSNFYLENDLNNNRIFNTFNPDLRIPTLSLNILSKEKVSYVVFNWRKKVKEYDDFFKQMEKLDNKTLGRILNNLIPTYVDNLFISPTYWKYTKQNSREDFMEKMMSTYTLNYLLNKKTDYDLFKKGRAIKLKKLYI